MSAQVCRSCGDVIDMSEFSEARHTQTLPSRLEGAEASGYCFTCYGEVALGQLPIVTDSSLPAPGTGLTMRQKLGQRHTDGG